MVATDDDGDEEQGVETSELAVLWAGDAIGSSEWDNGEGE